jgi:hypothetical protein
MGKVAIHVEDIELEDFYELIPDHCRKWVLCQHMIQILLQDIPICALLPGLADICIEAGAYDQVIIVKQAFQLICGFWLRRHNFQRADYQWALSKMKKIHKVKAWISFLSLYLMDNGSTTRIYQILEDVGIRFSIAIQVLNGYLENEFENLEALNETAKYLLWLAFNSDPSEDYSSGMRLLLSNNYGYLEKMDERIVFNLCLRGMNMELDSTLTQALCKTMDQLMHSLLIYDALGDFEWNSIQVYNAGCIAQNHAYSELALNLFICSVNLVRAEQSNSVLTFVSDLENRILDLQSHHKPQKTWY